MRNQYNIIREFKTKNFTVRVTAEEENDLDLSFDDTGEIREGLESGKFVAFCAKAAVYFRGNEIATDYLGNCIYESPESFMDHRECGKQNREYARQGKDGSCGSYFAGMIRTAIAEARKEIAKFKTVYMRA